jgi:hypothetical protein
MFKNLKGYISLTQNDDVFIIDTYNWDPTT